MNDIEKMVALMRASGSGMFNSSRIRNKSKEFIIGKINFKDGKFDRHVQIKTALIKYNFGRGTKTSVNIEIFSLRFNVPYYMRTHIENIIKTHNLDFEITVQHHHGYPNTYYVQHYNDTKSYNDLIKKLSLIPGFEFKKQSLDELRQIIMIDRL